MKRKKQTLFCFSYDQDSEYREQNVRSRGRPIKPALENLYKKTNEISEAKKRRSLKLRNTTVIPEKYHHWCRSLPSSKNKTDRVPEPQTDSEAEEEFE
jgi:hypothetical protein